MSIMHILAGAFIGLLIGRIFGAFTLRKVKGGKYAFMGAGVAGSFIADLTFKYLLIKRFVSGFWYKEEIIVLEMIGGAILACYLLSLLGRKESIDL